MLFSFQCDLPIWLFHIVHFHLHILVQSNAHHFLNVQLHYEMYNYIMEYKIYMYGPVICGRPDPILGVKELFVSD